MKSLETTVTAYLESLPPERKEAMIKLRNIILKNLPKGFSEGMSYGMMGYAVPHSMYPSGYHCNPAQPLPFLSVASQKNFIAFYHMGIYADQNLLNWFLKEYPNHCSAKLDMGKSCIRFKKTENIPFTLLGELCSKMTPEKWIEIYESHFKK